MRRPTCMEPSNPSVGDLPGTRDGGFLNDMPKNEANALAPGPSPDCPGATIVGPRRNHVADARQGCGKSSMPRVRRSGWVGGWGGLLLGLAFGVFDVSATRFLRLTIEQLASGADAVVLGRVMAVESSRDEGGRIRTRVDLRVEDVWKGTGVGGDCVVWCGGGILGDTEVRAVGQAEYAVGDDVVAYLVRSPSGGWVTLGMAQGRFRVTRDDVTGKRWVRSLFWGGADPGTSPRPSAWPPARPLSLEELKRRTREANP